MQAVKIDKQGQRWRRDHRVVITGMGIICPIGNDLETAWQNCRNGVSGVGPITKFDASEFKTRFAAEVKDFDALELFGARETRRMDPVSHLALAAAMQTMEDSGLKVTDDNRYDVGVYIGTGMGGATTLIEGLFRITEHGPLRVSPLTVPMMLPDSAAAKVAMWYELRGPNLACSSACASANNAIGEAAEMIRRGAAKAMIAGGTEYGVVDLAIASFNNMRAISTRNDDPEGASRPFDADRDGFVVAEGAACLMLESLEFAKARGAHIYGEVVGYGQTADGFHVTAPLEDGAGAAKAMERALEDASLEPNCIDYLNAHGTSTQLNDVSETRAIKSVFGDYAYDLPISSTKSMTGHLMGAAAAVEAVFSIQAIREGFIPPTINLENPDPECDLDYVPKVGRDAELKHVMSNSFGFGGHNAVLIFARYGE
jgi:3-oxoacyl-[acyl-carrier-protein] synthase II